MEVFICHPKIDPYGRSDHLPTSSAAPAFVPTHGPLLILMLLHLLLLPKLRSGSKTRHASKPQPKPQSKHRYRFYPKLKNILYVNAEITLNIKIVGKINQGFQSL